MNRGPTTRALAFALILGGLLGCSPATDSAVTPTEPLGEVVVARGAPIPIALLLLYSSNNPAISPSFGPDQERGVELAIADHLEIKGHPIEISHFEDDLCEPAGGGAGARRIVDDPAVVAVIGTTCSAAALMSVPILTDAGLSVISAANTSPVLTSVAGEAGIGHRRGFYRTIHSDAVNAVAGAEYAFDRLEARSAFVVSDPDFWWGEPVATEFVRVFESLGGTIAGSFSTDSADLESEIERMALTRPDLVYLAVSEFSIVDVLGYIADQPELADTVLLGWNYAVNADLLTATRGIYFTKPAPPSGPRYDAFLDEYNERFADQPIEDYSDFRHHVFAYDAASMLFDAIEAASAEDGGQLVVDREELRNALDATDRPGITGLLKCDEFGDCARPAINLYLNSGEYEDLETLLSEPIDVWIPEG